MTALHAPRPRRTSRFAALVALLLVVPLLSSLPSQAQQADARVLLFTETAAFRHTEAINQGVPVLTQAFTDAGISTVHTEDSSIFNPTDLATFDALVMFQASGDPWTADEKAAMEAYQQAGGGIVAIHNATDMRGNYDWWDNLIGTLMPGHAATGSSPGQPGTVVVEDQVHPSTEHLPLRWDRADEWYNYALNTRGDAHVLATMDESTYDPGGNAMGYDHPISWCKVYDGGRAWMTGMGHFGAHYTEEPDLVAHIVGGVEWAAGLAEGDCGGTDWSEFERVTLDGNTSAPFAMDIAPDGRVFFTELVRGQIRVYDPDTDSTTTAVELDVYDGGEDGLLGIALDPDFASNGHVFVYWAPDSDDNTDPANFFSRISRFTFDDATGTIDPASEVVVLEVPASRLPDEPGHTGGGLRFGPNGDLYLSVGDDVNPHSEPSGGYAPLHESSEMLWDARATSANTNDLRGKLLRIHPTDDGSYTIPEGNLIDSEWAADKDPELIRPEIYAMGFRNPFRFYVDPETGNIGLADYSPDNNNDAPDTRGPAGIAEWNWITEPGNYGWPLCMGANEPFRDVDYLTNPPTVGDFFDCDNPVNDSIHNTGVTELPPVKPADVYYGYQRASDQGSGLNQGGGLAPMGGPTYRYDESLDSDTKFPEYYDGKPFFYEWSRNDMFSFILDEDATTDDYVPGEAVEKVNQFLPQQEFLAPIDSLFGPDGSLYVLDWGGGFGRHNPDSGLHRIDYISGSRSPIPELSADPQDGQAPLEVAFSGEGSLDPEGTPLTYEWDFTDDGTVDATGRDVTHTYDTNGVYDARLTVTDGDGQTATATVPITVGNTSPEVDLASPPNGAFFDFGSDISWQVDVTDAEDDPIVEDNVVVTPALGHEGHAHPTVPQTGFTGSETTSLGGHAPDEDIFFVVDARYTDGGANGQPELTGTDTVAVYPRLKQAEFRDADDGITVGASGDVAGGDQALAGSDGAWFSHDPVNLRNVDALTVRAAATAAGPIELRMNAPDGELLGTADVPDTGGFNRFVDVTVDVEDPGETFTLYVVMPGEGIRRVNFIEAVGPGVSSPSQPSVSITSPEPYAQFDEVQPVTITADASDADNGIAQVEFLVDGVSVGVDDTAPYEATWTPSEENRYELEAVATNPNGVSTTSRRIAIDVGDLFAGWQTYTHEAAAAEFQRPDADTWIIESGGANMWESADEYGAAFQPAAAAWEQWTATVRLDSHDSVHSSGKAGLMVRNDITAAGGSGGYVYLGARNSASGLEWMQDIDGNGFLDASQNGGAVQYPQWIRVTKDGTTFQAYRSEDGENWTEVGDAATVDSAAAIQDVGVAVTAHSTTGRATAQFSNFSIVEGLPEPPEEPVFEEFPACVVGSADTFDGDSLDTETWTTVREAEGFPATVSDGALHLPVTLGDINEGETGPISYVAREAPDGPWEFTSTVSLDHVREWQHVGLLLHASDDEYVKLAWTQGTSGAPFLEFQTETGGSRTWHANNVTVDGNPDQLHLRLVSDGTELTADYSLDGTTWIDLDGVAPLKPDATIGIVAAGDVEATEAVAHVDQATLSTPEDDTEVEPSDEFDGDALDTCRWNAIVRPDASEVEVAGGHLSITTQPGDINGTDNLDPRNLLLQDAPEGDWTVETRLTAPLQHQWQLAGLLAYDSDDDYVKLNVGARNPQGEALDLATELVSEVDANFGGGGNRLLDIAETSESGYFYLRLQKDGDTYTGWVSDGGINWTQVGDPVTHSGDLGSIGLWAIGPQQTEPVTVEFDWFRVDDGSGGGDTTAPTVSASLLGTFTGAFMPASGYDTAGTATFDNTANGATLNADLSGLDTADNPHQAHLHDGVCGAMPMAGHYRDDPEGPDEPPNELWLVDDPSDPHAGFVAAGDGTANVDGSATWTARSTAQAVMVHGGEFGLPRGCATLDTAADPVEVVVDAADDVGVDTVEVNLDGGGWVVYDGPVTVSEPGDHTVEFRATDAAGNTSEAGTATFTIAGDEPGAGDQAISVTVPEDGGGGGEFIWTIAGDGSVDLGEMSNEGGFLQATGGIDPIDVTDTRDGGPTWSVAGQVSDFAAGLGGEHLGWTPEVITPGAGAVAGDVVASGIDGGEGLSVAQTLASAEAGHESGTARVGAGLDLRFPVDTAPGDYAATLTITALS